MITLTSETLYYENYFYTKFQAKFYTSDQSFEKQGEYLIKFKRKKHIESNMFSSEYIKTKWLLSPLNLHILKVTLLPMSKPRFIHLIKSPLGNMYMPFNDPLREAYSCTTRPYWRPAEKNYKKIPPCWDYKCLRPSIPHHIIILHPTLYHWEVCIP